MSDQLTLNIEERGEVLVAHLAGELDLAVAPRTGRRLEDAVPASALGMVVDFLELDFIDSSGVAMLFTLARQLASRRQAIAVVVVPGSPVARVLELVDFGRAAPVGPDLEQAVAGVAGTLG